MTILLVEDDALIAMDLKHALENKGMRVAAFASADDARAWLLKNKPIAAVCDFKLQHGTIDRLARSLKASDIPFLFYTGVTPDEGAFGKEFSSVPVLMKPCSNDQVVAAVLGLVRADGDLEASRNSKSC